MTLYPKLILEALEKVRYPGTGKNLVEAGMVEDNIRIEGSKVSFTLIFEKPNDPFIQSVVKARSTSKEISRLRPCRKNVQSLTSCFPM